MNLVECINENPRRKKCNRLMDVLVAPRALRFLLGEPKKEGADHYRITGEYHFAVTMSSNNKAHIKYVTIHDWEQTTVFARENGFSVEKFWGIQQPVPLKVSAIGEREALIIKGYLETAIDYKLIEEEVKKPRKKKDASDSDTMEVSHSSATANTSGHKRRGRKKKDHGDIMDDA